MAPPKFKKKHFAEKRSDPKTPNVRSASLRKTGKDGTSWTPTEKARRDRLMRQFAARNKGYGVAISKAYRDGYDGIDWSTPVTADDLKNSGGKK